MSKKIKVAQGAGGEVMDSFIRDEIIKNFIQPHFSSEVSLSMLDDAAVIDNIVFSTDSHTVQPLIFPGGDLGSLSVCGTINDVAVMERTHEIGIMKAIGARNTDVMTIFIVEGLLISLIGGIAGIILGFIGARGFTFFSAGFLGGGMLNPVITLFSILLAVSVSMFVGILSSLYPAWKAAKMSPIEAVRYE